MQCDKCCNSTPSSIFWRHSRESDQFYPKRGDQGLNQQSTFESDLKDKYII